MKHDAGFELLTGNNVDTQFFKAGSIIFREGDEAHELFVSRKGMYASRSATGPSANFPPTTFSARWR